MDDARKILLCIYIEIDHGMFVLPNEKLDIFDSSVGTKPVNVLLSTAGNKKYGENRNCMLAKYSKKPSYQHLRIKAYLYFPTLLVSGLIND